MARYSQEKSILEKRLSLRWRGKRGLTLLVRPNGSQETINEMR
jgi:hypothetical protein